MKAYQSKRILAGGVLIALMDLFFMSVLHRLLTLDNLKSHQRSVTRYHRDHIRLLWKRFNQDPCFHYAPDLVPCSI